jgi:hypothetical protein
MDDNYKVTICIDPDIDKSGVAIYHNKKLVSLESLGFYDLMQKLEMIKRLKSGSCSVLLEAGWLNKSNFHLEYRDKKGKIVKLNLKAAAEVGRDVGRNHEVGILIAEMCEGLGIPCRLIKPITPNVWKKDAEMFKKITGHKGVTNPEKRDAAMLGFMHIK